MVLHLFADGTDGVDDARKVAQQSEEQAEPKLVLHMVAIIYIRESETTTTYPKVWLWQKIDQTYPTAKPDEDPKGRKQDGQDDGEAARLALALCHLSRAYT